MAIAARALHYVFKIGDRGKNLHFFRNVLGMKVLRHEEFTEGCDAQCNGPYDNRWSKTMVGYGPEKNHFVIELTYNYGVKEYDLGNDFGGVTIKSKSVIENAYNENYPFEKENARHVLRSPDGYKFFVLNEDQPNDSDPVTEIAINSNDIQKSKTYWNDILKMNIKEEHNKSILLSYGDNQADLLINEISEPLNRSKAYGRIAFAVPYDQQPEIDETIKKNTGIILTPLITLDTPGKATVRVIILGDPNGHEICFVDEEGFSKLSEVDPEGEKLIEKYIEKDPFQAK